MFAKLILTLIRPILEEPSNKSASFVDGRVQKSFEASRFVPGARGAFWTFLRVVAVDLVFGEMIVTED